MISMILPKIFLGPMSRNVIKAVCSYLDIPLGFVASRRQIDHCGGYVCGFDVRSFHDLIRQLNHSVVLERDHGGPLQGVSDDDGYISLVGDVNYFDIIHLDVWKKFKDVDDAAYWTAEYLNFCEGMKGCYYEVGTEQDISPYSAEELDDFLGSLEDYLKERFSKILFAVIQSGTSLKGSENKGVFNEYRLESMVKICKKHGLRSKEHNGDYLDSSLVKYKFQMGLDAINIAPELGRMETLEVLNILDESQKEKLFEICLASDKWKKWVPGNFNPMENKQALIEICGHYLFSSEEFKKLVSGMESEIAARTEQKVHEFIRKIA